MQRILGSRRRLLLLQLPLVAISIALLLWRVDLGEAFGRLDEVRPQWVLVGLVMFTISKSVHAYRWRVLLRHRELPLRPLVAIFLLSNLVNALVPLRAGDLVRIELPNRLLRVPRAELASNVLFVESLFDGLAFLVLVAIAGFVLGEGVRELPGLTLFSAFVLFALAVLLFLARVRLNDDHEESTVLRVVPQAWRADVLEWIRQFQEGMGTLRELRGGSIALVVSIGAWVAEVGVYWMMGKAFGVDLGLGEAILLMVAANLIVSLPLTPWDIGPFEVAVTETFVLLGGDRAAGSSYAVGIHLLLLTWITITGFAAMLMLSLRPRDILGAAHMTDESPEESAGAT